MCVCVCYEKMFELFSQSFSCFPLCVYSFLYKPINCTHTTEKKNILEMFQELLAMGYVRIETAQLPETAITCRTLEWLFVRMDAFMCY